MNVIKPSSFYIKRDGGKPRVIAVMSDGNENPWGNAETERGLKTCLSRYAKEYGFVVTGETAQPAIDLKAFRQAAIDADNAFHAELVRQHGHAAGDNRYIPALDDYKTRTAREVFLAANERFLAAAKVSS